MTTYPSYVNNKSNILQLFESAAVSAAAVLKSGTFGIGKRQRAVLWVKTSAQAGGTVTSSAQLYDVAPSAPDTIAGATGPTDKVAHGSPVTTSGNQLVRQEFGTPHTEIIGACSYVEITMGGTGTITVEAWLELFD